jgi:hypothetical protein
MLSDDPIRSPDDPRLLAMEGVLHDWESWQAEHESSLASLPMTNATEASKRFIKPITLEEQRITISSFIGLTRQMLRTFNDKRYFVSPKRINSSSLESMFGQIRHLAGDNKNINAHTYARNLGALNTLSQYALTPIKSQVEAKDHAAFISDKPLEKPKRLSSKRVKVNPASSILRDITNVIR